MNRLLIGESFDPYRNLAVEAELFDTESGEATLYLWQNANTVVIGRNQNAWRECRLQLMEDEGCRLARRPSGGGAVYHDLGNLNFTFILPRGDFDLARQFEVIRRAVRQFGIETNVSGRNDLVLPDGSKFSGNAFRHTSKTSLHHGTLLLDVDMQKLGRYLSPSVEKMESKGVASVTSRVKNLAEFGRNMTVPAVNEALTRAFEGEYGAAERLAADTFDLPSVGAAEENLRSERWLLGESPRFDTVLRKRFPFGEVELMVSCGGGRIERLRVFTDAMDEWLPERLSSALLDAPFSARRMAELVAESGVEDDGVRESISQWIEGQDF